MPIYSNNRMGHMSTTAVAANESYTSNDIGRILYESQVNDMAIFEAVLASDFREIKGLQEGTILESEIAALNETTAKEFFSAMKERIKKFLAKVKGVIKDIITKIAIYVTRDGKKFVKEFEKIWAQKKSYFDRTIEAKTYNTKQFKLPSMQTIEGKIKSYKTITGTVDKTELLKKELGGLLGKPELSPDEFKKEYRLQISNIVKINSSNVENFIKDAKVVLNSGSKEIATLKETQADIEKNISTIEDILKKSEKDLISKNSTKEDKNNVNLNISKISALVSVYESLVTIFMGCKISAVKANIKSVNKYMREIVGNIKNESATFIESAVSVAEDDVDEALNSGDNIQLDDKTDEVEQLIDSAESDENA